ncbi:transcriptional activator hac1 [Anaeramoeba flamelloides]|uniref:Transcriptional activator hac1 n=1 Tax=Anaeramoeba flamelloides TaxID=1746091 RepID=A0AAV7Y447_9EUKA|nr:transcriptional activator hac1 [Anaeramoeba flamelloides]
MDFSFINFNESTQPPYNDLSLDTLTFVENPFFEEESLTDFSMYEKIQTKETDSQSFENNKQRSPISSPLSSLYSSDDYISEQNTQTEEIKKEQEQQPTLLTKIKTTTTKQINSTTSTIIKNESNKVHKPRLILKKKKKKKKNNKTKEEQKTLKRRRLLESRSQKEKENQTISTLTKQRNTLSEQVISKRQELLKISNIKEVRKMPAEIKRLRRLEKNRVSARKLREKKKQYWSNLEKECQTLREENEILKQKLEKQNEELENLRKLLTNQNPQFDSPQTNDQPKVISPLLDEDVELPIPHDDQNKKSSKLLNHILKITTLPNHDENENQNQNPNLNSKNYSDQLLSSRKRKLNNNKSKAVGAVFLIFLCVFGVMWSSSKSTQFLALDHPAKTISPSSTSSSLSSSIISFSKEITFSSSSSSSYFGNQNFRNILAFQKEKRNQEKAKDTKSMTLIRSQNLIDSREKLLTSPRIYDPSSTSHQAIENGEERKQIEAPPEIQFIAAPPKDKQLQVLFKKEENSNPKQKNSQNIV